MTRPPPTGEKSALAGGAGEEPVLLSDYDYALPPDRIAQEPAVPRDASRLMVLERRTGRLHHHRFTDLPDLLRPGDLLVFNDTRVFPARVEGRKATGGRLEFLFLRPGAGDGSWEALCQGAGELRPGAKVEFPGEPSAEVRGRSGEAVVLAFPPGTDVAAMLERRGEMPLPPYIRRSGSDPRKASDRERYQTVFARRSGAVAAPTAGLHFTARLLDSLAGRRVGIAWITLHVGPGTFLPVRAADARRHRMHAETFRLPGETAAEVEETRRGGGRVVAVGTTAARVLEHAAERGPLQELEGECDLYVLPGHRFRSVDALITNFHLPRSTLLLFVCAFAGRPATLGAYRAAVEAGYRFYSYGDAMLIL